MANVKVQAIMTAPRAEITWCRNQIEKAMNELRIPLSVSGGVYYGQCMQMMLEDAIDQGVEYAITVDGDSVFTGDQVHHLISLAVQEDMDALCAMQLRRGKPHMLGHRFGEVSGVWNGYPMQVDTAHFGLTVLNLKKLAAVEKPWFFCQPDENGGWRGNKIDSDIWFWCQWKKAGLKCFIDCSTRIGHVEEMVAIYDDEFKPTHMYPQDWRKYADESKACTHVDAS